MKFLVRSASYLFHPLLMPLIGVILFFYISPRFFPEPIVNAKILATSILTIFIPFVFYFLLKNMKLVDSIQLKTTHERKLPLIFFSLVILTVTNFIFRESSFETLFNFFCAVLLSSVTALFLLYFRIKVSWHMMGICGVTGFMMLLSILYGKNLLFLLSFLIVGIGWTASARLIDKAHNYKELLLGILIGLLPQFLPYLLYKI